MPCLESLLTIEAVIEQLKHIKVLQAKIEKSKSKKSKKELQKTLKQAFKHLDYRKQDWAANIC